MNNKKVISAVLLVSDGPVEHEYFANLLEVKQDQIISLFDEVNQDLKNSGIGFYIKYDTLKYIKLIIV